MFNIKYLILFLLFIIGIVNAAPFFIARARAGESNWEDHYRRIDEASTTQLPDTPNIFQSAWDDSLSTISSGWEQIKAGAGIIAESVGNFFSSAPKKIGRTIGSGLGDMASGMGEAFLGGTFAAFKFSLIFIATCLIFYLVIYKPINKYCCMG